MAAGSGLGTRLRGLLHVNVWRQGLVGLTSASMSERSSRKRSAPNDAPTAPSDDDTTFPHFATNAIHAGHDPDQWKCHALVPGIFLSTTFKQDKPGEPKAYVYTRDGNPTRTVLETCMASLEGAKYAVTASSGLAATSMVLQTLKSGDHVLSVNDVYGGTNCYFQEVISNFNIETSFVDATDASNVENAIQSNTKIVWIETPTNPTLKIMDIRAVSDIVHRHKDMILVVDNTFMTPYFQRPLELGADVAMHSMTKYLNGHTDVLMGILCTNNAELAERFRFLQVAVGSVPSPFDCYLANRGLKTLHLRMREHEKNAIAVAKHLEKSPFVKQVFYPGLPSHPQHELAKRQCRGFGGMVSFRMKGDLANSKAFLENVKVFTLAESLGGYESLVELPSIMTHASVPPEQRELLGITDTLIRMSVGLETLEDLIEDLDQALEKSSST